MSYETMMMLIGVGFWLLLGAVVFGIPILLFRFAGRRVRDRRLKEAAYQLRLAAVEKALAERPVAPPPPADPPGTLRVAVSAPTSVTPAAAAAPVEPRPVVPIPQPQPTRPPPAPPAKPTPPKSVALDLNPGLFAAVSDAEAKQQSAGGSLLVNLYSTGISSIIPPVSDPRTLLIDRGMVGHGLITPEQLTHIHDVGERYERVRPKASAAAAAEYRAIAQAGQAVVEEAAAEKARLRAEKKAAAAERDRQHARDVAHRKATDIVFLGRGVSKGLAGRTSDVERLTAAGLPVLSTPAEAAVAMGVTVPRLRWLAFHADATTVSHYVRFTVPKRSGGVRHLAAPHESLAEAQAWVLANVLSKVPTHPAAHGFVPGRSTVTNARPHVGRAVVVNADLTDFFPTITFPRVLGIFRQLGYSSAVATVFALLCTEAPRRTVVYAGKPFHVAAGPRQLPQGACTSPALSNLAARRLDSRLAGITAKFGWAYTRYADDLTISGPSPDKVGYLLARLRHITADEGFAVNEKKTRVQRPNTAQTVTGIVVNVEPNVPRATVRQLRAILHRAKTEGLARQNRENRPDFAAWVGGMLAYVNMVNPDQGRPLAEAFAAVR